MDLTSHKSAVEKAEIRLSKNLKRSLNQLKQSHDKKEAFKVWFLNFAWGYDSPLMGVVRVVPD